MILTTITNLRNVRLVATKAIFLLCLFLFSDVHAQIITTYAGTGTMGYSGDGGDALQAQMISPFGLALDKAGNLYVVDDGNNAIRKIDAITKVMTTVVGGGNDYGNCAIKDAGLTNPRGIAFDKDDNLYIADASTYIRKADFAAQTITTIAGTRGITDDVVGLGDDGPALDAHFDGIAGMAVDAGGNLFIADMLNGRIRRIDAKTGIVTTYAGGPFFDSGDGELSTQMSLNQPLAVALDKAGNVYIPDQNMIRKIDAITRRVTTLAGKMYHPEYSGDGGLAINATMSPIGITVSDDNTIYIADWGNQRIRKIDNQTGIISLVAGTGVAGYSGDCGPADKADMNWPWSVITNSGGDIFVADWHNYVIREITNDQPNIITGAAALCLKDSTVLTNEAGGGVWSSSNTGVATVDNEGRVRSKAVGVTTITYTVDIKGCSFTENQHTINVNSIDESNARQSVQKACIGSAALLSASAEGGLWLSSDSSVAYVSSSGHINSRQAGTAELKYLVQDQCTVSDKISVQVVQPQILLLGNDTSFCKNSPITLYAGPAFTGYHWNTGAVSPSILAEEAGTYSVSAYDVNQCPAADTITILNVFPNPALGWQNHPVFCEGSSIQLTVPNNIVSVVWQDLSSDRSFFITKPGTYWATVTDVNQCIGSDTVQIDKEIPSPGRFLPADTAICTYDKLALHPDQVFTNYNWSTGSTASSIEIETGGQYWLEAQDQYQCRWRDSISVAVKTCYNNIYFPTAFTPNHDDNNDVFKPVVRGALLYFDMKIYNRWGKQMFESKDWHQGWDGKSNDSLQEQGTYIWMVTYQLPNNNKVSTKGIVVLLR